MNAKQLTDTMLRYGIGLNPWVFENTEGKPKFPPHNIAHIGDDHYRLTLAVAGYSKDDLKITLQGEKLTVSGNKEETSEGKIVYRGIAFRNFTSEFLIGQHVRVSTVKLSNGMLDIDLIRELPENEKMKEYLITAE